MIGSLKYQLFHIHVFVFVFVLEQSKHETFASNFMHYCVHLIKTELILYLLGYIMGSNFVLNYTAQ